MENPTPWKRFRAELIKMIEAGVLEPGDVVSIVQEAKDFGLSYRPARRAFDALVAEGWLLPPVPGHPYRVPSAPGSALAPQAADPTPPGCHWPRCRLPDNSCDEARNRVG